MTINILALDTATEACSVALLYQGEVTHKFEINPRGHTQRILPLVDELLQQSGIALQQLDALAFGRGPGSFTGVRIGCGIAQGLAFGAELPVLPISNLVAMAQAAHTKSGAIQVLPAIDARMSEIYFSQLKAEIIHVNGDSLIDWQPVIEEQVISPELAKERLVAQNLQSDWLTVGTGWETYPELFTVSAHLQQSTIQLPDAQYMLHPALLSWYNQQAISAEQIEPVYLRNKVAWKKLPGRE